MPRQAPHHQTNRLTDSKIKAGIRGAPEIGKKMLNDGRGLYLQIHNQAPSWLHRYQVKNKLRAMGLGRYPEVSLARARELADSNRALMRQGIDPLVARDEGIKAELVAAAKAALVPSLETVADEYITKQAKKWRNPKSAAQWKQSLRDYVFPKFGKLPVDAIDGDMVEKALEEVWEKYPVTGERIRARLKKIFAYAKKKKYRSGDNPAAWVDELEHVLPAVSEVHTVEHFADLPYTRIAEFMTKLRGYTPPHHSTVGGRAVQALELLILTNSRTNEVLGALKGEVDLAARTWTRPASRMKSYKKPHTVTLSESAMAIVKRMMELHPGSPFIFPGENPDRPMGPGTFRLLLARLGYEDFDVHGFRACFRTWVQDCTNLDRIAAEIALAHRVGSVVEETYARGEMLAKRWVLAEAWDACCNGVTAEVVELPSVHTATPTAAPPATW